MTLLSSSNLSLVPGTTFVLKKNEPVTGCNLSRKAARHTFLSQRFVLPPPTCVRLFPQYRRDCALFYKPLRHIVSATETDVAVEEPNSPVTDEDSGRPSKIQAELVESTGQSSPGSDDASAPVQPKSSTPGRKSKMPPVTNEELVPGAMFTGKVKTIQPFGAFVDFGAFTDGLVHVSRLSDNFVKDVGSVVSIGQEVKVRLLEANLETGRISLSMRDDDDASKSQQRNDSPAAAKGDRPKPVRKNQSKPNQRRDEVKKSKFVIGQELQGTVKNKTRTGSFISLPEGEDGFLPVAEESGDEFSQAMGESTLQVGQEVKVRVLRFSKGQATLTMKTEEDEVKEDVEVSQGVVHVATNPFVLAFRQNKEISAFLNEREKVGKASKFEEALSGEISTTSVERKEVLNQAERKSNLPETLERPPITDEVLASVPSAVDPAVKVEEAPSGDTPTITEKIEEQLNLSGSGFDTPKILDQAQGPDEVLATASLAVDQSAKVEETSSEEKPVVASVTGTVKDQGNVEPSLSQTLDGAAVASAQEPEEDSRILEPKLEVQSAEQIISEEVSSGALENGAQLQTSAQIDNQLSYVPSGKEVTAQADVASSEVPLKENVDSDAASGKEVTAKADVASSEVPLKENVDSDAASGKEVTAQANVAFLKENVDSDAASGKEVTAQADVASSEVPLKENVDSDAASGKEVTAQADVAFFKENVDSDAASGKEVTAQADVASSEVPLKENVDSDVATETTEPSLLQKIEGAVETITENVEEISGILEETVSTAVQTADTASSSDEVPNLSDQVASQGLTSESPNGEEVVAIKSDGTVAEQGQQPEAYGAETESLVSASTKNELEQPTPDENGSVAASEVSPDIPVPVAAKASVSPALVKQLREETGAGMMDCKKALAESGGDIVKAQELLRKKGLASAEKKASRVTAEGRIGSYIHDSRIGVLVEVNCETDFVSRGDIFKELVDDLAMQVAAYPQVQYLVPEDVPEEIVSKEKEIEMQRDDLSSKPEQIRSKIVEGRIRKRLEEVALLEQPYIKNDKVTVKDWVKQTIATIGENIKVRRFVRYTLGEGLEKKSQDFAAEVAAQTAAKKTATPAAEKPDVTEAKETAPKPPAVVVSAALVKQLREETGAGMMDCKKALAETGGDLEKAQEYLRKKGLSTADKKSSRLAAEGRVGSYIHDSRIGVLIEVNCETDFVGRSGNFKALVDDLAMQVVACPQVQFVSIEEIPEGVVNKEKELERQREDLQSKPENIRERIVEGRVTKRLGELALLEQPFIKDDKLLVKDLVKQTVAALGENIRVRRFVRFTLGESTEDARPEIEV